MSRGLSSDFLTQLSSDSLKPFYAFKAEFQEGDVRLWTGLGEITINSETYTGGGSLLSVGAVEETSEIKATNLNVALSGLDSSILTAALNANYQNRLFTCFLGMLNESFWLVNNAYQLFQGRMDSMTINDSGEEVIISLSVESRLIDLEKPNESRYTSEEQKRLFSGDLGLDFVTDLQDKDINWGGK
tara:strand:+ start:2987 stop:3547 length:561 start_codon:yes stop_codon:yes gene_type:complete